MTSFSLNTLEQIIAQRQKAPSDVSYTAKLLAAGPARVAKKFGEEAVEAIIAATEKDKSALTSEAADVLYHLLVMLRSVDIPLIDVLQELEKRTSQSGLAEKASRPHKMHE